MKAAATDVAAYTRLTHIEAPYTPRTDRQ